MKRRKRTATFILYVIVIFTIAAGCGKQKEPITDQPALETVEYSNLTDEDSRKQLSELLTDSGIEESRIAALLNRVEQARQEYLDRRGVPQSYRWTTPPWEL